MTVNNKNILKYVVGIPIATVATVCITIATYSWQASSALAALRETDTATQVEIKRLNCDLIALKGIASDVAVIKNDIQWIKTEMKKDLTSNRERTAINE